MLSPLSYRWRVPTVVISCMHWPMQIQYIPRNMHTVFALLCFVVVIHRLIFPYPSGLLHWHCGNLTIAPVPAKQPWWIWIYTSCEFIMNDCITTTKQRTTKPCACFLGYTVGGTADPPSNFQHNLLPVNHAKHIHEFSNTRKNTKLIPLRVITTSQHL